MQSTLAEQERITAELEEQLRQERLQQAEAVAATPVPATRPAPSPARQTEPERPTPPTVLVFNNGSQVEVDNYVIVDKTLYEFAPHWTRKISLAELNVPATTRMNDDRGVEFRLPEVPTGR